jgi:hypothetical protein
MLNIYDYLILLNYIVLIYHDMLCYTLKEWSGTRNHPKADKHTYTGKFKIKGNWLIFGNKRKSITSNGTTFKIS